MPILIKTIYHFLVESFNHLKRTVVVTSNWASSIHPKAVLITLHFGLGSQNKAKDFLHGVQLESFNKPVVLLSRQFRESYYPQATLEQPIHLRTWLMD